VHETGLTLGKYAPFHLGHKFVIDTALSEMDKVLVMVYEDDMDYHGHALPELANLADRCRQRYDITFLCEDDIPYDNTWDRRGIKTRAASQKKTADELLAREIPFFRITGDVKQRVSAVNAALLLLRNNFR